VNGVLNVLCEKHFVNFLALSDEFLALELTQGDFWLTVFIEFTGDYFGTPQATLYNDRLNCGNKADNIALTLFVPQFFVKLFAQVIIEIMMQHHA
jgi:hypothetical protein